MGSDTPEREPVQVSAVKFNVGEAGKSTVNDQAGVGPYIPHEDVVVFDLACQ